jgi:hypothetical protein
MARHELTRRSNRRGNAKEVPITRPKENGSAFQKTNLNMIAILRIRQRMYRLDLDHREVIPENKLPALEIHTEFRIPLLYVLWATRIKRQVVVHDDMAICRVSQ